MILSCEDTIKEVCMFCAHTWELLRAGRFVAWWITRVGLHVGRSIELDYERGVRKVGPRVGKFVEVLESLTPRLSVYWSCIGKVKWDCKFYMTCGDNFEYETYWRHSLSCGSEWHSLSCGSKWRVKTWRSRVVA